MIPSTYQDVGELLSQEHAREKRENRHCLLRILSNVRFLARQGLAFRGDSEEGGGHCFSEEKYSNFMQLLKLQSLDDPVFEAWL